VAAQTKGSTNPLVFRFNKAGILAGVYLDIQGSVAGTLTSPNALGMASIVKQVEVTVNGGIRLHAFSGPQYHYLIRDQLEDFVDVVSFSNARSAVTATTFNISMWIPFGLNMRDPIGLIMLQNEQTEVTLTVEFEADATVATGATVTATVTPHMVVFSVPEKQSDWPDFSILHSIIGETRTVSGTGVYPYTPIRGHTYLQLLLGYGMAVAPTEKWNSVAIKVLGNDQMERWVPASMNLDFTSKHGRARLVGTIPLDWLGSSGLGSFGSARDAILSQNISDLVVEIDANATDTLHAVRRQLIQLN